MASKPKQVVATKVAVWKVSGQYFESVIEAEKAVRHEVVMELLDEQADTDVAFEAQNEDIAAWIANNWDVIDNRVKAAMAGC